MDKGNNNNYFYDEEGINYDDIPEITDLSKGVKNPYYGKLIKSGKCTIEVEHAGYNEVYEYDIKTGEKTVLQLIIKNNQIDVIKDDKLMVVWDIPVVL